MSKLFRDELEDYLSWRRPEPPDKSHLDRWIRYIDELGDADNQVWNLLASEAVTIIGLAVDTRRLAENAERGDEERKRDQETRKAALRAANSAAELAKFLRNIKIVLLETIARRDLKISLDDLANLHEREAEMLRRAAPLVHPSRIRRQRAKKGDRWSRGELTFMREMSGFISHIFGKKYDEAVAEMTNIAFDLQDQIATAEDVRSACKPSTRAARKRKDSGTLNR